MKKYVLLLIGYLLANTPALAQTVHIIVKEQDRVLLQEGDVATRFSPGSTFKIALSLMGYNEGILQDEARPNWAFIEGCAEACFLGRKECRMDQTPTTWMKNSVVWYSQKMTRILGFEAFKKYLADFEYGNQDVSGEPGAHKGLTHDSLSRSLKISLQEQVHFVQKLVEGRLPLSKTAHAQTKRLLFAEDLPQGWTLYGKRGAVYLKKEDGTRDQTREMGWFVGWAEKNDRRLVFACNLQAKAPAGPQARTLATQKILELIGTYPK